MGKARHSRGAAGSRNASVRKSLAEGCVVLSRWSLCLTSSQRGQDVTNAAAAELGSVCETTQGSG